MVTSHHSSAAPLGGHNLALSCFWFPFRSFPSLPFPFLSCPVLRARRGTRRRAPTSRLIPPRLPPPPYHGREDIYLLRWDGDHAGAPQQGRAARAPPGAAAPGGRPALRDAQFTVGAGEVGSGSSATHIASPVVIRMSPCEDRLLSVSPCGDPGRTAHTTQGFVLLRESVSRSAHLASRRAGAEVAALRVVRASDPEAALRARLAAGGAAPASGRGRGGRRGRCGGDGSDDGDDADDVARAAAAALHRRLLPCTARRHVPRPRLCRLIARNGHEVMRPLIRHLVDREVSRIRGDADHLECL